MHLKRRSSSAITLLLLAVALLMRMAVPSGWMPVADPSGLRVEICRGNSTAVMILGADGQYREDAPQAPRDPCPFGLAAGSALTLPELLALPAAAAAPVARLLPANETPPPSTWRALRPPARGPPELA